MLVLLSVLKQKLTKAPAGAMRRVAVCGRGRTRCGPLADRVHVLQPAEAAKLQAC